MPVKAGQRTVDDLTVECRDCEFYADSSAQSLTKAHLEGVRHVEATGHVVDVSSRVSYALQKEA